MEAVYWAVLRRCRCVLRVALSHLIVLDYRMRCGRARRPVETTTVRRVVSRRISQEIVSDRMHRRLDFLMVAMTVARQEATRRQVVSTDRRVRNHRAEFNSGVVTAEAANRQVIMVATMPATIPVVSRLVAALMQQLQQHRLHLEGTH
jgi:hypothetical protein